MKNFILRLLACICLALLTAEIYLAVQGAEISRFGYSDYFDKPERDFIENIAGWGANDYYRDGEDPDVFIKLWKNGARESRMNEDKKTDFRVAFVGCSYTFGCGVKAEDTMAWRLNDKYPNVTFDNWGILGWGPAQIYLRIKYLLENGGYSLIVYNAMADHLCRSYGPHYLTDAHGQMLFCPYADWDCFGRFKIYSARDILWPFQNCLLTVNELQRDAQAYKTRRFRDKYIGGSIFSDPEKLDRCVRCYSEICNRMYALCLENNTDFVMCSLEGFYEVDPGTIVNMNCNPYIRCETINAETPDGLSHTPEYRVGNNISFHPNGKAHAYWAEAFSRWFDEKYPDFSSAEQ